MLILSNAMLKNANAKHCWGILVLRNAFIKWPCYIVILMLCSNEGQKRGKKDKGND